MWVLADRDMDSLTEIARASCGLKQAFVGHEGRTRVNGTQGQQNVFSSLLHTASVTFSFEVLPYINICSLYKSFILAQA